MTRRRTKPRVTVATAKRNENPKLEFIVDVSRLAFRIIVNQLHTNLFYEDVLELVSDRMNGDDIPFEDGDEEKLVREIVTSTLSTAAGLIEAHERGLRAR